MRNRNPERNRVEKLWSLAASIGIDLPEEVVAARDKEHALKAALAETNAAVAALPSEGSFHDELYSAGKSTDAYRERLGSALARRPLLEREQLHFSFAIERAENAVIAAVRSTADDIITDLLQPVLSKMVESVASHADAAGRIPWGDPDAAMRNTDQAVRKAYVAIADASDRYGALRDAQDLLHSDAHDDTFGEMRNLRAIWPAYAARGPGYGPPPWSAMTGPQRINWLVNEAHADLWCPTPDQIEEMNRTAAAGSGLRSRAHSFGVSGS